MIAGQDGTLICTLSVFDEQRYFSRCWSDAFLTELENYCFLLADELKCNSGSPHSTSLWSDKTQNKHKKAVWAGDLWKRRTVAQFVNWWLMNERVWRWWCWLTKIFWMSRSEWSDSWRINEHSTLIYETRHSTRVRLSSVNCPIYRNPFSCDSFKRLRNELNFLRNRNKKKMFTTIVQHSVIVLRNWTKTTGGHWVACHWRKGFRYQKPR